MRKYLFITFLCVFSFGAMGQKQIIAGDCTITYSVTGADANTNKNLAGTTKILYVKGKLSRVDLISSTFTQSIIYDNKTGTAVVLKEVGPAKYISTFNEEQWSKENKRFEGMKLVTTGETKTILGYECKKAVATLKDGTAYNMFYATSVIPTANENPYQFKDVPGLVLEYETWPSQGASKITFSATLINFDPVPAMKFEIPTSGYRALQ